MSELSYGKGDTQIVIKTDLAINNIQSRDTITNYKLLFISGCCQLRFTSNECHLPHVMYLIRPTQPYNGRPQIRGCIPTANHKLYMYFISGIPKEYIYVCISACSTTLVTPQCLKMFHHAILFHFPTNDIVKYLSIHEFNTYLVV